MSRQLSSTFLTLETIEFDDSPNLETPVHSPAQIANKSQKSLIRQLSEVNSRNKLRRDSTKSDLIQKPQPPQQQPEKAVTFEDFLNLPILEGLSVEPTEEEIDEETRERIKREQQLHLRKAKLIARQQKAREMYSNAIQRKQNAQQKMKNALVENQKLMKS